MSPGRARHRRAAAGRIRLLVPEVTVTVPLWTAMLASGAVGALCGAYAVRRRD